MKQSYGQLPERMKWGPAIGLAVAAIALTVILVFAMGLLDRPKAPPSSPCRPAAGKADGAKGCDL